MGRIGDFARGVVDTGRKTIEGAQTIKKNIIQSETFQSVAEFAGKWKDQKVVEFKDWKDRAKDSLKLQTVEKWGMLTDRGMMGMKDREIKMVESEMGKVEAEIRDLRTEEGNIEAKIAGITNPDMKKLLEDQTADIKAKIAGKIDNLEKVKMQNLADQKAKHMEEKESLQQKIKSSEEKLSNRIDGKIEDIKNRYGLEEKMESTRSLGEDIRNLRVSTKQGEEALAKDAKAISELKKTGADLSRAEAMLEKAKKELLENKRELIRKEAAKSKLDQQIKRINEKTGKWEEMKAKYNLGDKNESSAAKNHPHENLYRGMDDDEYADHREAENAEKEQDAKQLENLKSIEKLCSIRSDAKLPGNFAEIQKNIKSLDTNDPTRKFVEKMGTTPPDLKEAMKKIKNFVKTIMEAYE